MEAETRQLSLQAARGLFENIALKVQRECSHTSYQRHLKKCQRKLAWLNSGIMGVVKSKKASLSKLA